MKGMQPGEAGVGEARASRRHRLEVFIDPTVTLVADPLVIDGAVTPT